MPRVLWKESLVASAAAVMAVASLSVSVFVSNGLQGRIIQFQETTDLRRQFALLVASLREAEAAQRNFLITGNPEHAAPLDAAAEAMPDRFGTLRDAARHNEHVLSLIAPLEEQATVGLAALANTANVRRTQGRDAALLIVEAGGTHAKLVSLHQKLAAVTEQLEQTLAGQSRDMMQAESMGRTASVGAGTVALMLGAFGLWQWRSSIRHFRRELKMGAEKSRAEQIARDKGDFLAAMSHEVRTPLNVVLALSEELRGMLPPGTAQDHAAAVHIAGSGMLRLVNDLLDLSRLDAGSVRLMHEVVWMREFAHSVGTLLAPQVAAAGVKLEIVSGSGLPPHILGDEGRLRQIILNLAGNALKFTPAGGSVIITMDREAAADGRRLVLEVKDTGRGIPLELQHAIFRPYVQVQPQSGTEGGTGLGLAIVRQLVRLMNGSITLQSQLGQGSTFRITLPLIVIEPDMLKGPPASGSNAEGQSGGQPAQIEPPVREKVFPLKWWARERLDEIMSGPYATALSTQSTADVTALAKLLNELGQKENSPLLCRTAEELWRASASFALESLGTVLHSLPERIAPLKSPLVSP